MLKIKCPECGAGLKSANGFTVGQTVPCPKCETYFSVEEPDEEGDEPTKAKPSQLKAAPGAKKPLKAAVADDDDEDDDYDAPKKKKRKKGGEERSYKNSPLRFAILGVLLLILGVLATLFVMKKMKEREVANAPDDTTPVAFDPAIGNPKGLPPIRPQRPGGIPVGQPNPKQPTGGAVPVNPLGGLVGGGPANTAEAQKLTAKYRAALVGTWTADLGNGVTEELTYTASGSYTATRKGSAPASATGKYTVLGLVGSRGLKLELTSAAGARKVSVIFEGDELEHPSLQPGVTGTFRKK